MTTFFLDLWQDLRDKRLWPVAVGLLAAAVAIPAIMLKPAAAPTQPPIIAANGPKGATLPAISVDDSPTHGSKLESFAAKRNPFKPLADLEAQPGASDPSGNGSADGIGSGPGSGSGSGDTSAPGGATGGNGSPGVSTPSPDTSSPTPSSGPNSPGMHWFKLTADVEFGVSGKPKT